MPLSLLLALALQTAPDVPSTTPAPAVAKTAAEDTSDIPSSAPTDDYGFVSWCRGALSGHMQLYPSVKDELRKIETEKAEKEDARYTTEAQREAAKTRRVKEAAADEKLDQEQLDAGKMYLKLYEEAIDAAEQASAANIHTRGMESQEAGFRIWAAARGAEPRTRMWSWVMWELPARCETASRRLKDRSLLLGGALRTRVQVKAEVANPAADAPALKLDETPLEVAAARLAPPPSDAPPVEAAPLAASAPDSPAKTPDPEAPVLRGELAPTPPSDTPVARREPDEAPAPAPAPAADAPKS